MAVLTPEERADREMTEIPTLTDAVVKLLKRHGWRFLRLRQGRATWNLGSGFPDIEAVKLDRHVYIELKRQDKGLEPEQEEWRNALMGVPGVEWYLFRPRDLRIGLIEDVLR